MAPNICSILLQAQLSGRAPRTLLDLPQAFCERLDGAASPRAHDQDGSMSTLLLQLSLLLRRQEGRRANPYDVAEMQRIVSSIGIGTSEGQSSRDSFLACRGDVVLVRLLHLVAEDASDPNFHAVVNDIIQILAEFAISDPDVAEAFATHRPLIALLFQLMQHKPLVDAALTLAQELLAVGPDIFPLAAVEDLAPLLSGLTPRGLSLVGRALAVLLAKAAEDTSAVAEEEARLRAEAQACPLMAV